MESCCTRVSDRVAVLQEIEAGVQGTTPYLQHIDLMEPIDN